MARLPALVDTVAGIDDRPRGAVDHVARAVREAGLIQTTRRGRGAAEMTARDAAALTLGFYGAIQPAQAAVAADELTNAVFVLETGNLTAPELAGFRRAATLGEALACMIELGGLLDSAATVHESDRPSGFVVVGGDGSGYAALAILERPHGISSLTLARTTGRGTSVICRTFVKRDQVERSFEDVAPVQTTIRLHTRVFSALHETLFPKVPS